MARITFDSRCLDAAEELLSSIPGATEDDIQNLACDFQDAFERVADQIEERQEQP